MGKLIKLGLVAGLAGTLLFSKQRSDKTRQLKRDILDLNSGPGDIKFFVVEFFKRASFSELEYIHNFLVNNIKPRTPKELELHHKIWNKYELGNDGLGSLMAVGLVAKMIPYLLIAGGGMFAYSKFSKLFDGSRTESYDRAKWYFVDEWGVEYNAIDLAVKYRSAMDGGGTYETTLYGLAKLSRGSRFDQITAAYKKITKDTLTRRLEDELDEEELSKFNAIKDNKPPLNQLPGTTHYEFGIGEEVEVGTSFTSYVYYEKQNGSWVKKTGTFKTNYGGNNMGEVKDRKQLGNKTIGYNNYYSTTEYPYRFVIGAALNRI